MRTRRLLLAILALAALSPSNAMAADWPTYHGDNTRQGNDSADPALSSPRPLWASANLDGKVYGSPVVVGGQVIVATENDTVYSLDPSDGAVLWSTHLGTPRTSSFACGNINPLGITGTPAVSGTSVYVAAEVQAGPTAFHFLLVTLNLATGRVSRTVTLDPPDPRFSADVQQQRGAMTITGGRAFIPLGGLEGDCGNYHGYVLSYPLAGIGGLQWWADTEVDPGNRAGGIWAPGGLSVDAAGYLYAATGNSSHTSSGSTYDYSDGVVKLDPSTTQPVDYFAPATWYQDNAGDVDLGSTTPLQLPNNQTFIVGKSGTGYLLNNSNLGHIGGQLAAHRVCHATNSAAFGSLALAGGRAFVGCSDGMAAVTFTGNDFSIDWYNTSSVANRPPIVAGGLVWAVDSSGGQLLGLDPGNAGQLVHSFAIDGSTRFTTPSAANGHLYVGSATKVDAFGAVAEPAVNGVTLDAFGGLHHFGSVVSNTQGGPHWGWAIARGLALRHDHAGGYVLDGWGGVHPVGGVPVLSGQSYWPGWDIARSLVLSSSNTGGYVLDGWGGIHPIGDAPAVAVTAYWPGWDIAVGLVLRSDNRSGWVLDGWGGLHPFAARGAAMPPAVTGSYWLGWNIARSIALASDQGGYVLDGWGGVHPFGDAAPIAISAYWGGWDIARAIALFGPQPSAGYVLDGFGGLHPAGPAPPTGAPAYLFGQDVFRSVAVTP